MSTSSVELKGVNVVKAILLTKEKLLVPHISENDKTPLFDGNILVYTNSAQKISDLYKNGFISIQVKGSEQNKFPDNYITHSIPLIDLEKYYYAGGLIYFKVYIDFKKNINKIYFINLLPYIIKKYLEIAKEKKNKKSINVELYPFPEDFKEIYSLLKNYIRDYEKQKSLSQITLTTMELQEKYSNGDISYSLTFDKNRKLMDQELNTPIFIYHMTGEGLSIPIDIIVPDIIKIAPKDKIIKINDKIVFTDLTYVAEKGNKNSIVLGNNNIILGTESDYGFSYNSSGDLNNKIGTLIFLKELLDNETSTLYINDIAYVNFPNAKDKLLDIVINENFLSYLQKLKKLMDILRITTPLNVENLTDKEIHTALAMYYALVEGEEISVSNQSDRVLRHIINLQNITFLVTSIRNNSSKKYRILDYFGEDMVNIEIKSVFKDKEFKSTAFHSLSKAEFLTVSNINYKVISDEVKKREPVELYLLWTNVLLLEILSAYDESANNDALDCAIEISQWLLHSCNSDDVIYLLNHLQCVVRKRILTQEEKDKLYSLQGNTKLKNELAIALILHDGSKYNFIKNNPKIENIENLLSYPIGALVEKLKY